MVRIFGAYLVIFGAQRCLGSELLDERHLEELTVWSLFEKQRTIFQNLPSSYKNL